ncbi:predicted protein [Nematostella vectensis]|uniref:Uncharacterized protein n=1 Tax=Nematostella vectensis TaxID=45351 RepID=A7SAQ5_NEMVE|nr:predicted protein [Nematostella vectensis]|eukprot:XP_001631322.1 predicted protein [Nematostella vectensis]
MAPSIPLPLLLLAAFFSVSNSAGFESNFKGEEYISYDLRSNRIATETNHISMQFKTFHPSGLVMHSSGTQGDFVTLEMIHGKLRHMSMYTLSHLLISTRKLLVKEIERVIQQGATCIGEIASHISQHIRLVGCFSLQIYFHNVTVAVFSHRKKGRQLTTKID